MESKWVSTLSAAQTKRPSRQDLRRLRPLRMRDLKGNFRSKKKEKNCFCLFTAWRYYIYNNLILKRVNHVLTELLLDHFHFILLLLLLHYIYIHSFSYFADAGLNKKIITNRKKICQMYVGRYFKWNKILRNPCKQPLFLWSMSFLFPFTCLLIPSFLTSCWDDTKSGKVNWTCFVIIYSVHSSCFC